MVSFKESGFSASFDSWGVLTSYCHEASRRELFFPHRLWRLILDDGQCKEIEAVATGKVAVEETADGCSFMTERVRTEFGAELPCRVTVHCRVSGGALHWRLEVGHDVAGLTVREAQFPIFSLRNPEPPLEVHTSKLTSETIVDLPRRIQECLSGYMAPDHKYVRKEDFELYPGRCNSMNFYLLQWGEAEGFYFGCHDSEFGMTMHSFEREGDRINMFMTRYPFLKAGNTWLSPEFVTSPYQGAASVGARIYRRWADTWFTPPAVPPQVRHSLGWQRIILKHQYGEYFFRYDDLEQAYEVGRKAGLDTLFLFGWTSEGMDAGYPQYTPDASQGGKEALRRSIMKVRAKGGHVILYFNGQLIDATSEYYRSGAGQRVSIKREDGTEHREYYNFSNTGSFCRMFVNKTFVVACPACQEWIDILKQHIDFAAEVGADSVFFDQLGLASYPCCDPTHGHQVPFMGLMKQKRAMLKELYEYTHSRYPGMGLGIECVTDQTAQYADFIHTCGNVAQVWNEGWRSTGEVPQPKLGGNLLKTVFPELILSDRDVKDDSDDVVFRVNQMLLQGMVSDAAVFRCRGTIADAPLYMDYQGRGNAIRERHRALLMEGTFSPSAHHAVEEPDVQSSCFMAGDELAVLLTQANHDELVAHVHVPGYCFTGVESLRDDVTTEDGEAFALKRDSFAFVFYRRTYG